MSDNVIYANHETKLQNLWQKSFEECRIGVLTLGIEQCELVKKNDTRSESVQSVRVRCHGHDLDGALLGRKALSREPVIHRLV